MGSKLAVSVEFMWRGYSMRQMESEWADLRDRDDDGFMYTWTEFFGLLFQ